MIGESTVVSQPNTKIVMASLDSRDRVASNRDLATVVARLWVLKRNSRGANILWVSSSLLIMANCQAAPDTSQPVVKMAWVSSSRAN